MKKDEKVSEVAEEKEVEAEATAAASTVDSKASDKADDALDAKDVDSKATAAASSVDSMASDKADDALDAKDVDVKVPDVAKQKAKGASKARGPSASSKKRGSLTIIKESKDVRESSFLEGSEMECVDSMAQRIADLHRSKCRELEWTQVEIKRLKAELESLQESQRVCHKEQDDAAKDTHSHDFPSRSSPSQVSTVSVLSVVSEQPTTREPEETQTYGKFEPQEEWSKYLGRRTTAWTSAAATHNSKFRPVVSAEVSDALKVDDEAGWFQRTFIAEPGSNRRALWDVFGAVLIFYELIAVPMEVFDHPTNAFTVFMDWLMVIFWTLNMGASLLLGYVSGGNLVMEPSRICLHYLRTWFIVDVLVLLPEWVFIFAMLFRGPDDPSDEEQATQKLNTLRFMRLARMTRLLRILRLRQIMEIINDFIDSEFLSIVCSIAKMIVLLLIITHLLGCAWFGLAKTRMDANNTVNWVDEQGFDMDPWEYQYLTSLHWAITQFTPASMSVQPQNSIERLFAFVIVVFALVGFSYIVGSITGSLAQLRHMSQERHNEFWTLRRFMKQGGIPKTLAMRVGRYLENAWKSQRSNVSEKDVKIFALLSEPLYYELQWEIAFPVLKVHPIFTALLKSCRVAMHRFANRALKRSRLVSGDSLFVLGDAATSMYFLCSGSLVYKCCASGNDRALSSQLMPGEVWITEQVLWTTKWAHVGICWAEIESEVIQISPRSFAEVVSSNPVSYKIAAKYAYKFLLWLNELPPKEYSDVATVHAGYERVEAFLPYHRWGSSGFT